ncbi:MAG: glycerol-3-phosphate acyltransferase [Bacillota bacterium]
MSISIVIIIIILVSYGLGTITGAYYIVKMFTGEDIRKLGSGNVGATNAGRAIGKKGFLLTLMIDAGKVILALMITAQLAEGESYFVLSTIFVMIGHLFPIQLEFHGGKGVVAYLASALFLSPLTIGVFAFTMGVLYMTLRKYTIAGFLSMATIPIMAFVIDGSFTISIGLLSLFVFVLMAHKR